MELYPHFEFLSDKPSCLFNIYSIIGEYLFYNWLNLSAGNRNPLPPMIALKIFACPKSQREKCGNLLMLPSSTASIIRIFLEEMLLDVNTL